MFIVADLVSLSYKTGRIVSQHGPQALSIAIASHHFIFIVEYIRDSSDIIMGDVFARLMPC